jgi:hypothetical protein
MSTTQRHCININIYIYIYIFIYLFVYLVIYLLNVCMYVYSIYIHTYLYIGKYIYISTLYMLEPRWKWKNHHVASMIFHLCSRDRTAKPQVLWLTPCSSSIWNLGETMNTLWYLVVLTIALICKKNSNNNNDIIHANDCYHTYIYIITYVYM